MPKHPSKPAFPATGAPAGDADDLGSARHRMCGGARAALARTEQLSQRLEDHVESDNQQLTELAKDVAEVRGEVKTTTDHVGNLRVDVAKTLSIVDNVQSVVTQQQEVKHMRMIAEVETGAAERIATIEDTTDRAKARRAFWTKVLVTAVSLGAGVVGALIEHYR